MKFGIRKFSLKKRISSRVSIKRQLVHRLGLKMPRGYGWIRSPRRFGYNKIYNLLTVDLVKLIQKIFK